MVELRGGRELGDRFDAPGVTGLMEDGDCRMAEFGSDGVVLDGGEPNGGVPGIGADEVDDEDGAEEERLPGVDD